MRRVNITVIVFSLLILAVFGAFATSHIWVPRTPEKDVGTGLIIVGGYFLMHVGLTIALVWSTLLATISWHRNSSSRTTLDGAVLGVGSVIAILAIAYAAFFIWG